MRTTLFILFSFFIVFGCGTIDENKIKKNRYKLNKKDLFKLNFIVDSIYEIDQNNRKEFRKLDSIFSIDNINKKMSDLKNDETDKYRHLRDSLWQVTNKNDLSNTILLLKLTKEFGFLSPERLKTRKAKAYLIFVHSPKEYFKIIEDVIDFEFSCKRISAYERDYILWHINGRNGFPPMFNDNY